MIVADVNVRSAKSVKAVVPDVVGVTFVREPPPAEYVPEALTSLELSNFSNNEFNNIKKIKDLLKSNDPLGSIKNLLKKNKSLEQRIDRINLIRKKQIKDQLKDNIENFGNSKFIFKHFKEEEMDLVKQIAFELDKDLKNLIFLATIENSSKPFIVILISKNLVNDNEMDARNIIKILSKSIDVSGGGQNFLSTAGGKKVEGLEIVKKEGKAYFQKILNN